MTDDEIIDALLSSLNNKFHKKSVGHTEFGIKLDRYIHLHFHLEMQRRNRIIDSMKRKGLIEPDQKDSYKFLISEHGRNLISEYGSYSNSLIAAKKEQAIKKRLKAITIFGPFMVGVIGLGWGVYQDMKNSNLENENQNLNYSVDSLDNENRILKELLDAHLDSTEISPK
jgi:predicted transcriptional regulator